MNNKEKYKAFCTSEPSIPIFFQYWWLDTVAGPKNWDVAIYESGGSIVGTLVYCKIKSLNKEIITLPLLTQKNGVWLKDFSNQKNSTRISNEMKIMDSLIDEIEKLSIYSYNQNFDYKIKNWLPFKWRGYTQTSRYTYLLEELSDLEGVYNNFDSKLKNQIRKAEKSIQVKRGLSIEEFYEINKMSFDRQGMNIPYSLQLLKNIDKECEVRKCREILYAVDSNNNIHSAIYIVWDKESAYYLMGGADPKFAKSESTSLLLWDAIKYVAQHVNKFDFEGSMIKGIEKFFRSFGGSQKQYFNINKKYKKDYIYDSRVLIKRIIKKLENR